jgi:hypothetical protein
MPRIHLCLCTLAAKPGFQHIPTSLELTLLCVAKKLETWILVPAYIKPASFGPLEGMAHTRRQRSDTFDLHQDRRGLRFSFSAGAEVSQEGSVDVLRARVTELSLRGCFLEVSGRFAQQQGLQVKIFNGKDFFEASAEVIYVRKSGVGVLFGEMNPHFRQVLLKWILAAIDRQ